ncbi:uncharacterized protein LOC124173230 [Ischnura elegans]|uniref:uncharacterized protein LOC124173230 n=1 Tax=Ischnura elegans TaxID=197161 RepID=UPI001ED87114|nr:uncharacterized protein LOC124173230 [Ischnura elegans]
MASGSEMCTPEEWIWTEERTLLFIAARQSNAALFTGRKGSAATAYGKVAKDIGYPGGHLSLKKKWENLVDRYKKCKYPRSGVSTEGGDKGPLTWRYYDAMDNILSAQHNITPPVIVDSGEDTPSRGRSQPVPQLTSTRPIEETPSRQKRGREESSEVLTYLRESDRVWQRSIGELVKVQKEVADGIKEILDEIRNKR